MCLGTEPDGESAPAFGEPASAASLDLGSDFPMAIVGLCRNNSYHYQLIYRIADRRFKIAD